MLASKFECPADRTGPRSHILRSRRHGRHAGKAVDLRKPPQQPVRPGHTQGCIPFPGIGQFTRHHKVDIQRDDRGESQRHPPGVETWTVVVVKSDQSGSACRDVLRSKNSEWWLQSIHTILPVATKGTMAANEYIDGQFKKSIRRVSIAREHIQLLGRQFSCRPNGFTRHKLPGLHHRGRARSRPISSGRPCQV